MEPKGCTFGRSYAGMSSSFMEPRRLSFFGAILVLPLGAYWFVSKKVFFVLNRLPLFFHVFSVR